MVNYSIRLNPEAELLKVQVVGAIDEDVDFSSYSLVGFKEVIFDLIGITRINSCGIRDWIKWLQTRSTGARVTYLNCPKIIVEQINMVQGFLPESGFVGSFFVPYYSEATNQEVLRQYTYGVDYTEKGYRIPNEYTDESGITYEMDVTESKYLKFLKKLNSDIG